MRRLLRVRKPVIILDKWGMKRYLHKENLQTLHSKRSPRLYSPWPILYWMSNGAQWCFHTIRMPASACLQQLCRTSQGFSFALRLLENSPWLAMSPPVHWISNSSSWHQFCPYNSLPAFPNQGGALTAPTCGFHCEAELFLRLQPKLVKVLYGRLIWSPLVMSE